MIETLEGCGWEVLTETKIEDTFRKDGGRIRTFTLADRYDIAVVCKKVDQLFPVDELQEEPDQPETEVDVIIEDEPAEVESETESEIEETEPEIEETEPEDEPEDNFWMDESNWKRTSRNAFKELVKDNVGELKAAPDSVQGEVYKKWTRFFDKKDWPL
jgi:negative regulator of genetic competence, sporulation and motility